MIGIRHILSVMGFVAFVTVGWMIGGWLGAVLGVVLNAIVIGIPVTLYEDRLTKRWRLRKRAWLEPFFGDYLAPERQSEWERASAELAPGVAVRGIVVHREPGYAYVDIGCGFPGLLELTRVPHHGAGDPAPENRKSALPGPGEEFEARVRALNHAEREVRLARGK